MDTSYHRHDINGKVWELLEPHLPGQRGQPSLKRWRGIATRYVKTSDAFIAAVHVRCFTIWAAIRV